MFRLSPSKLNLFNDCPRCFWDEMINKLSRPRGIMASLPIGIDSKLKKYLDNYRGTLPPELSGKLDGALFNDAETIRAWRNWRVGLSYTDNKSGAVLIGALDDCIVETSDEGKIYIPLDYKTKASAPKFEDAVKYYQTQLNCYNLMLEANGYKIAGPMGLAYLVYFWPEYIKEIGEVEHPVLGKGMQFIFGVEVFKIPCDIENTKALIKRAVDVLNGERPLPGTDCEYCSYIGQHKTLAQK
jgi:hypothetical protein